MSTPLEILRQYWHYDQFRPQQDEAIRSILSGRDTLVLLPTGGGKSVCFQVPALAQEGLCLVVSPLISLMRDQVAQLRRRHIPVACLTAGMTQREQETVLNQALYGRTKLLYVSPERLKNRLFLGHLRQMRVSFFAVDEAHCVSQWGYDFRPDYLDIARIRQLHPQAPLMALTATATPRVADDIVRLLEMRSPARLCSSFARPNISFMVLREKEKFPRLLRIARKVGGSGIVYVRNRRDTYYLASALREQGIDAEFYNAGLTPRERTAKQRRWTESANCVMVATNAFGMGIDKADVRFVVHYTLPDSLEAYYQEAGRAGRDGKKAYAVTLLEDNDLDYLWRMHEQSYPDLAFIRRLYSALGQHCGLPVGSGAGEYFHIDPEPFCRAHGFDLLSFYGAMTILSNNGLVQLPERRKEESQLRIELQRDHLLTFSRETSRYGELVAALLRHFPGIFTEYTYISEARLAQLVGHTEAWVMESLAELDRRGVVKYQAKSLAPQLLWLSDRQSSSHFALSQELYHKVRDCARQRAEAMQAYVTAEEGCRAQMLLAYFGENQNQPCHQCDLCLTRKK